MMTKKEIRMRRSQCCEDWPKSALGRAMAYWRLFQEIMDSMPDDDATGRYMTVEDDDGTKGYMIVDLQTQRTVRPPRGSPWWCERKGAEAEIARLIKESDDNTDEQSNESSHLFDAMKYTMGNIEWIEPEKRKEKEMLKAISAVFKDTDEALLVEKHLSCAIYNLDDAGGFLAGLIVAENQVSILAEAKRLQAEEDAKKK